MKKAFVFIIIFVLLAFQANVFAAAEFDSTAYGDMQYLLMEANSGQILAQQGTDKKVYPASTTKLMTALLLAEQKGLEGNATAGAEVAGMASGSSLMGLKNGETVTVKDLLYGLLLCSGNDAANTIGVYVSGSVEAFVELMNSRAAELGMADTHFVNAHGVYLNQDEETPIPEEQLGKNHYSTVADMSLLAKEVAKHPDLMEVMGTKKYTFPATNMHEEPREMFNSNPLLVTPDKRPYMAEYLYPHTTGMKTGTVNNIKTTEGDYATYGNFVASAQKDGLPLIALVFGDTSSKEVENEKVNSYERWPLTAALFDYGFDNFTLLDLNSAITPYSGTEQINGTPLPVTSAPSPSLEPRLVENSQAGAAPKIETNVKLNPSLPETVNMGDVIGSISYTLNGEELYSTDLLANAASSQPTASPANSPQPTESSAASGMGTIFDIKLPFPPWVLFIMIPVGIFVVLLIIRCVNLTRRKMRHKRRAARYSGKPQRPSGYSGTKPARPHGYSENIRPAREKLQSNTHAGDSGQTGRPGDQPTPPTNSGGSYRRKIQ